MSSEQTFRDAVLECEQRIAAAQSAVTRLKTVEPRVDLPWFDVRREIASAEQGLQDAEEAVDAIADEVQALLDGEVCRECGVPR